MINETGEAIKEAKFIRNNITNITVLTAKFKSLKELHMFHMRKLYSSHHDYNQVWGMTIGHLSERTVCIESSF